MSRCQVLVIQLIEARKEFHSASRLFDAVKESAVEKCDEEIASKVLYQPVRERLEATKKRRIEEVEQKTEEQQSQRKSFKENIRTIGRIIRLGKPDVKLFLYALAFIFFAVLYPTTAVKLVGAAIDAFNSGTTDEDGSLLIWGYKYSTVFGVMVPFMCVSAVCFWARIWTLKVLGERLVARLRLRVMKTLLRHDAAFYDQEKNKVGDLISRLSSDAYVVSRSITGNLPDGLKNLLFGIISAYMMFSINPLLFGVMLLISPPITFGSVWYGEKIRALSSRLQNAAAGLTKVSEETLNAAKLVQAYTAEQKELTKYSDKIRNVVQVARKEALAQSNYLVSIYLLYHSGYLACIALGVYLIINGKMTTGDVVAFTMYSELFNLALYSLTTTYMELMKGAGAGTRLFELIDYKSDVNPVTGTEKMPQKITGDIDFKDVWFAYPTRPKEWVFQGVSFHVPSGSSTCLVAPSGAGKSTVATLLLRSYNIQKGEILIGGANIANLQVRDLRRDIIGVVQQEPVLLSGSILENIVYGLSSEEISKLTMDDIISVCKQANCHDFICVFPEGYDTIIGSRGALLSGGQKQRIAIARALIKKPKILILDEATSALDSKLESLINETLKDLTMQGKLTIVSIAHRLSTISKSENIIVLGKNGKVVEEGKFVQLFLNPDSELSKLLDESLYMQQEEKISEDEVEEIEREDRIAQEVESGQKTEKLDAVRSLIDELPYELRKELIEQINKELESDNNAALQESTIPKSKILS